MVKASKPLQSRAGNQRSRRFELIQERRSATCLRIGERASKISWVALETKIGKKQRLTTCSGYHRVLFRPSTACNTAGKRVISFPAGGPLQRQFVSDGLAARALIHPFLALHKVVPRSQHKSLTSIFSLMGR